MRRSTYYFFTLLLTALFLLPWSGVKAEQLNEGFEGTAFAPEGWTNIHVSGLAVFARNTTTKRTGTASAWVNNASYGENYLITPKLKPESGESFTFYVKINENANNTALHIKVSTSTPEAASFTTTLITYNTGSKKTNKLSTSWAQKTINLSSYAGQEIYIAFHAVDNYGASNIYIDDIAGVTIATEEPAGGCPKPKNLTKSADTPEGATFTWEQNDSEDTYQWACVAAGAEVASWNTLAKDVREVTVDGLTAGTAYDFHVRSYCGDGEGEQSASAKINFTPTVPAPTYGANPVSDKTHNSATVTWTAASGITKYQYVCVLKNATPNWTGVEAKEGTSANITGLSGKTEYDFYVRSWYSETAQSIAVKTSFETECGPKSLPYEEPFSSIGCWTTVDANSSTGIYSSAFRFYYDDNKTQYLISPQLVASEKQLQVEFKYWVQSATYPESFRIGYSTTNNELESFTWKEEQTNLTNGSSNKLTYSEILPVGVKYIAIHYTALGKYALFIDDFSATEYEAPSCANPTGLTVGEIETTTAQISWTSDADNFALEYKKTSDENWTAATGTITSPFTLEGLEPNETEYTVRVKAICTSGESSWVQLAQPFKTDCEAKSIGWSESFEGALPCWSKDNNWTLYTWSGHTGSNSMRFTSYAASNLVLPAITLDAKAQLVFWHSSNYVTCSVYANSVAEENKLAEFAKNGEGWKKDSVDLSAFNGQTVTLIIRGNYYSGNRYLYIDDVTVTELPCEAPTNLTVAAGATTATFAWDSNETAWKLQYKAEGDADWTEEAVNAKSFKLTNLTVATNYQARVQSACGGDFAEIAFSTWCDAQNVTAWPIDQTFGTTVPECWVSAAATPLVVESNYLFITGVTEQIAVLPLYNIDLNKLSVTLTYAASGSLQLGYINNADEFVAIAATLESGTEIDLADLAPAAPTRLAIKYTGANANSASISSVYLRKTPTCLKPTNVAATPGVGAASISWTAGGSETAWNLQYKLASAASWSENIEISETPSYNLTGLEQGLSYKVRVQAACAGEDPSDWSDEASFTTDCEGIAALPWNADFSQALSACWTIYAQDETYYKPVVNTIQQDLQISGGKDGASNNIVVLPAFSADLSVATMSFEYRGSTGSQYAQLEAGYMTDKDDATTFTALETLDQEASYTQARIALNTVPAGKYLAFRYAGGTEQGDQYIKNIRVSRVEVFSDDDEYIENRLGTLVNKTIDIIFNRTLIGNYYYNTLCLPFSLDADQLAVSPLADFKIKAFDYAAVENEELLIAITNASAIEAGVPYFVANNVNEVVTEQLFQDVTITAATPGKVDKGDISFQGVFDKENLDAQTGDEHDQLFLAAGNKIYWPAQNKTVKGFRAYFNVNLSETGPLQIKAGMPVRMVERTGVATGCENVNAAGAKAVKLLENGQVVIIRNGIKYTIQGKIISK